MIYFEINDIYSAIAVAFAFGILTGGVYGSLYTVNFGLVRVLWAFSFAFSHTDIRSIIRQDRFANIEKSKALNEIFDFLYFFAVGVIYICLMYLALDGVFRLYMFIFLIFGFYISRKTLGALFDKIIRLFVDFVSAAWSLLLYVMLFPCRLIIHKILVPLLAFGHCKILLCRSKKLIKNKNKKIESFFVKTIYSD